MSISMNQYVKITSGVAGAPQLVGRNFGLRCITINPLLPTNSYLQFSDAESVGNYFGFYSEEFQRANFYFNFVSKNITSPSLISFWRWTNVDTAPLIFGKQQQQLVSTYQTITNGSFSLTIAGTQNNFTGLNFSTVVSLADVAAIVQAAINSASGTMWTAATVAFNPSMSSFEFTGGQTGVATISVQEGVTGTPIAGLLGWLVGAILSNGNTTESITQTLNNSWSASNNFGTFIFMPSLSLNQIEEACVWTDEMNVQVMYQIPVTLDNAATYQAAIVNYGGCGLTISETPVLSGIAAVTVSNGGQYTVTPTPEFIGNGSGATLSTQLKVLSSSLSAPGSGYATNDTLLLAGGTHSAQVNITVNSTALETYTVTNGGSGFAPGDTITFSDGTFLIAAQLIVDTVDGGGAIVTSHINRHGIYSVNSTGASYTTNGSGIGATFSTLLFGVNTFQVTNPGIYTALPTNPVAQQSSSGSGTGATFTLNWQIFAVNVTAPGTGYDAASQLIFLNGILNAQVSLILQSPPDEYSEEAPAMVFAATNYAGVNSVQNYMYQQFNLTPTVSDDKTYKSLNAINVNYYGVTQESGDQVAFYQRGFLQGEATEPNDMGVYANEIWLKDAIIVAIMNLQLSSSQIPANKAGQSMLLSTIQTVIDQAINNGTISVGKTLTNQQKLTITTLSGDPNAWKQVQNIGYWINCLIVPYVDQGGNAAYKAVPTLIYSKNDVIRFVDGFDILI